MSEKMEIKLKILELLEDKGAEGCIFKEIYELISGEFLINQEELKQLLEEMEKNELIEKRIFPNGRIDYTIEQKGIEMLSKLIQLKFKT